MFVTLLDNPIEVVIIRKKNKNIYFRFKEDLKLYVTCSAFITLKEIERLIIKNQDQLVKMYNKQIEENNYNSFFNYLGNKYTIIYDPNEKKVKFEENYIIAKSEKQLNKFYKDECLRIFNIELEKCKRLFNNLPEFQLKIRSMKTRWGVCNRSDFIVTLNSELLKKQIHLIDYVIIHELCHFYHGNHSKNFWNLVEQYYPNHKLARKMLKEC